MFEKEGNQRKPQPGFSTLCQFRDQAGGLPIPSTRKMPVRVVERWMMSARRVNGKIMASIDHLLRSNN
jgi:hypothetical protein